MSKYYYLIAGLPELSLEDSKLSYTVADFKVELYPALSEKDKGLIDLFYLKYDNANVLKLLRDKEAVIDARGIYSADELTDLIGRLKEGDLVPATEFPTYLSLFIQDWFATNGEANILLEDKLAAYYYSYAMKCKNQFVSKWFAFSLLTNNVMVALTARKHKMEVASLIVGEADFCEEIRTSNARDFGLSAEVDEMDTLMKIADITELLEREKRLDMLRWKWMEDASVFNYFTVERLFVFLLQLEMIERWISLDKEKGNEMFRSLIDKLKDEVQIPAEFR